MNDADHPELPPLSADRYEAIARAIASDASPVGIDAKKTHVYILHLLLDLDERLRRIEEQLDEINE